jgi:putative transposase
VAEDEGLPDFARQSGYGAFSVGTEGIDAAAAYVRKQAEHHAKVSFQDEYRALLREAGIEFDERYVWD